MSATYRPLHVRTGGDGELGWIGVSALIHAAVIAVVAFLPTRLPAPRPMESYTVDLVAPSTVGGTNLIPGRPKEAKKPAAPPPKVEAAAPQVRPPEPKPPVVKPEAKPQAPEIPPKPIEEAPKAEVAPPKAEAEKPKEVEKPKVEAAPKPEAPKAEPKREVKEAPVIAAKPAAKEPPKVEKPAEAKPAPKPEAPPAAQAKAKAQEPAKVEKPAPPAQAKPADKTTDVDKRIAAAVQRRAKQVQAEPAAGATSDIDRRIAAAVERRAQNVQEEAKGEGGGPISYGPGEGSGGVVRGVDYILYRGHMEDRIKAAWAWAGANRALRAVVRFNILENGEIVNVQIVTPSGDASYDSSIERALRAASPLNPPPENYRSEFSTVELEFRPEDLQS
jgi:TolA protein